MFVAFLTSQLSGDQGAEGDAEGVYPMTEEAYNGMVAQPAWRTLAAEATLSGAETAGEPGHLTGGFLPRVVRNRTETENLVSVWGC